MKNLISISEGSQLLIVDDTPIILSFLTQALTQQGYNVTSAINGQIALNLVENNPPDLILLDIKMPEMDGYEVCQQLKASRKTSDIPVIFLTGLNDLDDKIKAFQVGGVDYLIKPFHIPEVLIRIENQLRLQTAKREIQQLNEQLRDRIELHIFQLQQEILDHKETQKQLRQVAFHDSLTGFPNRILFLELLQQAINRSKRRKDYLFAVLLVDCDRFKLINDSLGHKIGDQILIEVANRLETCLRPVDTIARLAGDEFIILLEDLEDITNAFLVAQRIINSLNQPISINNQKIFLSVSIGIVMETRSYDTPEDIVRDADIAMERAKQSGQGSYQVFLSEMHSETQKILQLEIDLRNAFERKEFTVYYQPIVSLFNQKIIGFEALLRWQHPEKGFISPAEFIPVAENTGLIILLGMWVLKEACSQLTIWQQYPDQENLTISVNLSVKQFAQPDLIEQIDSILAETGLESQYLKLEITESAIMDNEAAAQILQQLKDRKIQLSIDDFGTGYSSLSYLHRFAVNTLKIDRSFISRIGEQGENLEIVQAIANLAHHLGMDLVAEGIETPNQHNHLNALGCQYGQGYLFSKPLERELIEAILTR